MARFSTSFQTHYAHVLKVAEVEGKSGKAEVATPAKRAMGSAGANAAEGKMVWASSGKRSDRKKRPAQQVRPVISPDKPKPKSPDVLMTSVIETLAQAASVSRLRTI